MNPFASQDPADAIKPSHELDRILALPRRAEVSEEEIEAVSAALRIREFNDEGERNVLFAAQVEALRDCYLVGGLVAPMRCGSGKTLVTLLLPTLLGSRSPVLIAPADLVRDKRGKPSKTKREYAEYRLNWNVRLPRLVSYEEMGREDRNGLLAALAPDLVMLDEAHIYRTRKLNARASAMARRVSRARRELQPRPVFVCLSGTFITDRLMDYAPAMVDCLGTRAPVALDEVEASRWGQALDRDVGGMNRLELGALASMPGGFHKWMRETRGIVSTPGKDCDASIEISAWEPETPPALREVIDGVAESSMRPDGEMLEDLEVPNYLTQLALGFFYVWDPMPPDWWLDPRRSWLSHARDILDREQDGLDSEGQLRSALTSGRLRDTEGADKLARWLAVCDQFKPNKRTVWLDGSIMEQAAATVQHTDAIVWTRLRAAGLRLAELGIPYYDGGTTPESSSTLHPICCSIKAHGTGKNLQARSRSLVLTPMGKAWIWEQLIARMHRVGQRADVVRLRVIHSIEYHDRVMGRVLTEARAISKAAGENQKIVDATIV